MVAGALLADGATRAAARLVEINLAVGEGDVRGEAARELAARARAAVERALDPMS